MKRLLSLLLAVILILLLTACGLQDPEITTYPETYLPGSSGYSMPMIKEPPSLTISLGAGDSFDAGTCTYSWTYDTGDGTMNSICADSPHPLDLQVFLAPVETSEYAVELQFEVQPQSFTVRCWSDSNWGNTIAVAENASLSGNMMKLKEGGYIYEVEANWTEVNLAAFGTVHYVFYVIKHGVKYAHEHSIADVPQTVDDPVTGYYDNIMTTIVLDGKEYTFMGSDSVNLTDIRKN